MFPVCWDQGAVLRVLKWSAVLTVDRARTCRSDPVSSPEAATHISEACAHFSGVEITPSALRRGCEKWHRHRCFLAALCCEMWLGPWRGASVSRRVESQPALLLLRVPTVCEDSGLWEPRWSRNLLCFVELPLSQTAAPPVSSSTPAAPRPPPCGIPAAF